MDLKLAHSILPFRLFGRLGIMVANVSLNPRKIVCPPWTIFCNGFKVGTFHPAILSGWQSGFNGCQYFPVSFKEKISVSHGVYFPVNKDCKFHFTIYIEVLGLIRKKTVQKRTFILKCWQLIFCPNTSK